MISAGARFLIWAHFPVSASHVTPASPGPSVMVKAWRKQWWLAPVIRAQPTPTCLEWFGKCFYLMLSERNICWNMEHGLINWDSFETQACHYVLKCLEKCWLGQVSVDVDPGQLLPVLTVLTGQLIARSSRQLQFVRRGGAAIICLLCQAAS